MELRHLRYFEAVARHSHVTRAAAELHIAQPALSKQISQLEQELGVALFDRVGRNVQLTEAGEALLPHARTVMAQVEAARLAMAERVGLKRGRAAIGTPPTIGTRLLPQALAAFHQRFPGIELRVFEAGIHDLLDLLDEGQADAAIVSTPIEDAENLEVVPLFHEELVIAVANSHRLATRSSIAMSELRDEAWLLAPESYELRESVLNACEVAGYTPKVVIDGGETDTLLSLVAAGVGLTILPRPSVRKHQGLVDLPVSDQRLSRALALVWRRDRAPSPAARALRDLLIRHLSQA